MTREIPFIARMLVIKDVIYEQKEKKEDASYYNPNYDSENEYCQNTTSWD